MRAVLNSLIIILLLAIAGWVYFANSDSGVPVVEVISPEIEEEVVELADVPENNVSDSPVVPAEKKSDIQIEESASEVTVPVKTVVVEAPVKVENKPITVEEAQPVMPEKTVETAPPAAVSKKIPSETAEIKVEAAPAAPVKKEPPPVQVDPPAPPKNVPVKPAPKYICHWAEDFVPDGHDDGVKFVDNWKVEGGVLFTPKTRFYLRNDSSAYDGNLLVIESKKSSAVFACDLSEKVDLNKTPILRWRWRVKKFPPFGDGRHRKKDDQAVGVYVGSGNAFNQKAISYRWETDTPVGHWGKIDYSKVMRVWFLCMRNKDNGTSVWHEECRDVRKDFIEKYGYVPKKIVLVICGNSQNSKSDALAEIDYIGFYEEVK